MADNGPDPAVALSATMLSERAMPHFPTRTTRTTVPPFAFRAPATAALAMVFLAGCAGLKKPETAAAPSAAAAPAQAAAPSTFVPPSPGTPTAPTAPAAPAAAASGAASTVAGAAPTRPTAPAAGPLPAPASTGPGSPPTFASVIRDARRFDGPLTLWQKDDRIWLELAPEQFGKPFLMSPKIKTGIGEAWVLGGLMGYPINGAGGPQVVEFVRVHNTVRLQARNTEVMAKAGTPEALAVASSYSASLLGSTAVASQPHPDRKSVLIDATSFFTADQMGIGMMLQRNLRQGYGLERSNTGVTAVRATPQALVIEVTQHYVNGSPALPVPGSFAALFGPTPTLPRFLPDSRSLLVGLNYSLAPLPDKPMATRVADPRVGLFSSTVFDFSNDLQRTPRQRFVNRWRLEKKDPAAPVSDPVTPITFWIDKNVPNAYRETVRSAILEWNKAFEKIGFSNAIVVQQQPDDATWDTLDYGYSSVRWMMNADPVFGAIGPSHTDPRTGEILDADIAFEGMSARSVRGLRAQVLGARALAASPGGVPAAVDGKPAGFAAPYQLPPDIAAAWGLSALNGDAAHAADPRLCLHATLAAEQMGYAMDVLEARGELDPDSPVAQQFVLDYVKDSIMHEVGHALGLRHNFRASRIYTEAQLADVEFTRANGTTGSVMEYNPVNLARPGAPTVIPFQTTLGPYDYWAIEYAYRPIPEGTTPEAERAELQKIAARSNDPKLAFGTDEDAFIALDPETLQLDLGSDPIAFAAKRLEIARDLFKRQETRPLPADRDYAVLRRSINYALSDAIRAVGVLVRQIGGVRTLRDYPGSGRDPLTPVPAKVQREALDLISKAVLTPEGLTISPALQRRLAPDYLDRAEVALGSTEYQLPERLLGLQSAVLGYFMSDVIASRILDGVGKHDRPAEAFQLSELYERLMRDVWVELDGSAKGRNIPAARRELQRDHVNRMAIAVLRPIGTPRADARGLLREQARTLLAKLQAAQARNGLDAQTRAHLADCTDTLKQALAAQMPRLSL
jgi:hypothetical protein